jgi:hypothetical protein
VVELREEVTRAREAGVMEETHAAQVERMARERTILVATTHGEADEAA